MTITVALLVICTATGLDDDNDGGGGGPHSQYSATYVSIVFLSDVILISTKNVNKNREHEPTR